MKALTYTTAPAGTLLLGLGSNGLGEFSSRTAGVIVEDQEQAERFTNGLPKTSRRRIFTRPRPEGGYSVTTDVQVLHSTALAQFNRFVAHAVRSGFTPAAAVVPVERRGVGQYSEAADIEAAFASALGAAA